MSKFKIEIVSNHICKLDNFIVSYYMPAQDRIVNTSFYYEELARTKNGLESGMWRIKSLKKTIKTLNKMDTGGYMENKISNIIEWSELLQQEKFEEFDKKIKSVERKIKKGFALTQRYSFGLPIYRLEKDNLISNYPRINEEFACLLKDKGIKITIIN